MWWSVLLGGGNLRTRRKPPTCRKSLTNFITTLVVIGTDSIGSCKSNYHTITTTTAPITTYISPASNTLYSQDITETLLKVALNTIKPCYEWGMQRCNSEKKLSLSGLFKICLLINYICSTSLFVMISTFIYLVQIRVMAMVFNPTFNTISDIWWRLLLSLSVLYVLKYL